MKFISAKIKKILVKNDFWTTKSKDFSGKKFKNWEKQNLGKKIFEKKILKFFFSTIPSANPVESCSDSA